VAAGAAAETTTACTRSDTTTNLPDRLNEPSPPSGAAQRGAAVVRF
jgi:hypothetical protein